MTKVSAINTFPNGVLNVMRLTEIKYCVGKTPALLYNSCQRAADQRLATPSKHTAPCYVQAVPLQAVL